MWSKTSSLRLRGVTLFEALVTATIMFLILSAVATLLQSSLRALKSQQGRELSEVVLLHTMLGRELSDAVKVVGAVGQLTITRGDPEISWEQLRTRPGSPETLAPVEIRYRLVDDKLLRHQGGGPSETMLTVRKFDCERLGSEVKIELEFPLGQRVRYLVWTLWSAAL